MLTLLILINSNIHDEVSTIIIEAFCSHLLFAVVQTVQKWPNVLSQFCWKASEKHHIIM